MTALPLAGHRVLVTRAAHQAGKLSNELRKLGAEPVEVPVLEIQPPEDIAPLDRALSHLQNYDWLIVTSANTARALAARAAQLNIQLNLRSEIKVAAVGDATAAAVQKVGLKVTFVPVSYVAESLIEGLKNEAAGQKILLTRAAVARDVLPEALSAIGSQVDVVEAYRNVMPEAAPAMLKAGLGAGIDAATFTSSSSVTHLAEAAKAAGLAFPLAGVAAISIGPITSQTLREHGWEPAAEANPSDIPGLVATIAQLFKGNEIY